MRSILRIFVSILAVTAVAAAAGVIRDSRALAAVAPVDDSISPGVLFLIDVSGSMGPASPYGNCDAPSGGLPVDTVNNDCNGNTGRSRLRAAVLALRTILDANHDGAVNDTDFDVLKFRIGMVAYSGNGTDGSTVLKIDASFPVGTSYENVYCGTDASGNPDCNGYGSGSTNPGIEDLVPDLDTPTAEALVTGVQNGFGPCFDGSTSTTCLLNPRFPTNYWTSDDRARACRPMFVVLLTDGLPNGGLNSTGDPVPAAQHLLAHDTSAAPYGNNAIFPNGIKTYAIGFGQGADFGVLNCIAMKGGTDANLDGDNNAATSNGGNCSDPGTGYIKSNPYYANERGPGNAFSATNTETLAAALQKISNQITAGTYSETRPAVSTAGDSVYTAFFDVSPTRPGWKGHLRKFKVGTASDDSTYTGILNCAGTKPTGGNPANAIQCWDAGSLLDQNVNYGNTTASATSWQGRNVYAPLPQASNYTAQDWEQFVAQENWDEGAGTDPGATSPTPRAQTGYATGDTGTPNSYLVNLSSIATAYTTTNSLSAITGSVSSMTGNALNMAVFAENSVRKDQDNYGDGSGNPASWTLVQGWYDLQWAVGNPTALYGGGTPFCDTPPCTSASPAWKLQDSFNADPVLVTAPSFATEDPDFAAYQNGTSYGPSATAYAQTVQFCKSGVTAPCAPKDRASVLLIESNDGMLHCFDEATGYELWAILPWHAMPKVHGARISHSYIMNSRLIVREVKFDSKDGDGHWHTVVFGEEQEGGDYYYGVDVTDPIKPRWLWEWHDREEGLTFGLAALGRPCLNGGGMNCTGTGDTWLFSGGGVQDNFGPPDTEVGNQNKTDNFMTRITDPHDQKHHVATFAGQAGLAAGWSIDAVTGSNGLANMPGDVKMASSGVGTPLGAMDRGYEGDQQGRIWKWCNIDNGGNFKLHLFFDPAFYFFNPPVPPGYEVTNPVLKGNMWDRAPQYFAPDVTMETDLQHFDVVLGQGDITRPLADPASLNSAFVWTISDRLDGNLHTENAAITNSTYVKDDATCAAAVTLKCASGLGVPSSTLPSPLPSVVAPGKIFIDRVLTGPPVVFNNYVLYSEYRSHGAAGSDPATTDVCVNDGTGRLKAYRIVGSPCDGTSGGSPLTDPATGTATAVVNYTTAQGMPSGPVLDQNGNVFVQTSAVGVSDNTGGLQAVKSTLGNGLGAGTRSWRQIN